jgi:very-short-patch-repair endonuclease
LEALLTQTELLRPTIQYEVKDGERLVTVPDFAYPEFRIAVFCDGFAYHGNPDTLELDARKRNWLQEQGWIVLTFWGKTIMRDAGACAREILSVYQQRKKQADSPG